MPLIKTTRTARFALWALRVYHQVLLALIGLKFVRMSRGSGDKAKEAAGPIVVLPPKSAP
jgi:hypothetical protein